LPLIAEENKKYKKMDKTRFLGITLFTLGIILMYKIDNDLTSFIGGILIGIGGVMTIAGKSFFTRKS
jgi:uncharacterized membrane protein YkgB